MNITRLKIFTAGVMLAAGAYVSTPAQADLLLEPYLGYHSGTWKYSTTKQDAKGVTYGARIGYQTLGFMIGLDYMTGAWEDDVTPEKNEITPSDLGIFVGYNFPVLLRVYGVLAPDPLNPSLKVKDSTSSTKYEGSTMKFGVGFTPLPLFSINFEMITGAYDEADGDSLSTDLKTSLYGVTLSLPLTF